MFECHRDDVIITLIKICSRN